MAMITGGGDSGVETEGSNDLDIVNVNVINEQGDPILDLPDSGPSSSESDLNQQLGAAGSSFLGPDGGPSILLGIKDKGDDPPPPPPPTSPNICAGGNGLPEFLDTPVVQNFSSDSLDGMIDETEEELRPNIEQSGVVNMEPVLSSHVQPMPVIEDEVMERDELSDEEDHSRNIRNIINHERPHNGGFASPSKRFLSDIPEPDFAECASEDGFAHRYPYSFSSTVDLSFSGSGESSAFSYARPRAMSDSFHPTSSSVFHHPHPPPAPPVTPTNMNNCRALVKFEFPELPKLVCQFEPPAGLRSFMSIQPFQNDNQGGYTVLNSAPSASDCRALIPYEQKDLNQKVRSQSFSRKTRNKLYDNWANIRKEYNEKRLRTAAGAGSFTMVQKLLTVDIDPNAADELGRTALHIAACKGFSDIVSLLLSSGANPNARDCVGNTPLHLAACTNHFDVVTCLLRAGTDVSTLDNNGRNPLQLAQSKLKLLANWKSDSDDALKIKNEVRQIVEMILEYLQKKGQDMEAELLNDFANRLTLSQTAEEVDADVKNLLANLSSLTINVGSAHATSNPIRIPPKNPYLNATFNPNLARPRSLNSSPTSSTVLASSSGSTSIIAPARFAMKSPLAPCDATREQKQLICNLNRRRAESEKSREPC
ncbi:Ankyrin repeat domain-containing protein 54 [Orchesella cincta]|uniref:Ankyrin repeat domain-containing protein 54 n=1 Tax=Orchesella cincta TaxID=48709 RepID=A0A1D2N5H5_ORCCI|nr:Ankyrin repeat domain-containing protein 54 [Orchesella cincta]